MNILDKIIRDKRKEVARQKNQVPLGMLAQSAYYTRPVFSLTSALQSPENSGIIAEFKRKSPSKGMINENADPVSTTTAYLEAGAVALSVLTDWKYFGGTQQDLRRVRESHSCPILRKDFIIDEYQVHETKSLGADAILLIAAALDQKQAGRLAGLARELGLEILFEIHHGKELSLIPEQAHLVGVNNRDLSKMITNVDNSRKLAEKIPDAHMKISESGIHEAETILELKALGYKGFLIGEHFMFQEQPGQACKQLIEGLTC